MKAKRFLFSLLVLASVLIIVIIHPVAAQEGRFMPVPKQATPQDMPKEGYILQRIGKSGYVVIAGFVQACFVVTESGVVLIDAPPALADILPVAIKSVSDKPVTHIIETHDHFDHIGAVTRFSGAKLIAHSETAEQLRLFPDPRRPVPSITFKGDSYTLKVGGVEFRLIYPGPNHEIGNIIVYIPEDRLAILTDVIMPGWAPFRGWGNADHIPGVSKALDAVLKLDFDTFVGGHHYRTGSRADVGDSREFIADLWRETKAAMAANPFKPAENIWAAQEIWFDQVADQVSAKLIEKWKGRLAGVDVFTHDTVVAVMVSWVTDGTAISDERF